MLSQFEDVHGRGRSNTDFGPVYYRFLLFKLCIMNYCSSSFYLEFFVYFLIFFIYSQDAPILQEASQSHEVSFLLVATQLLTILKKNSNLRSHNVMLNNFVVIINYNSYAIGR